MTRDLIEDRAYQLYGRKYEEELENTLRGFEQMLLLK